MIIVYTEQKSPRLTFILTQLLGRISGAEYVCTTDRKEYMESSLPGICYHEVYAGRGLWMIPSRLLWEEKWSPLTPATSFSENGLFTLFPTADVSGSSFPFDLFSAAFYLLSRYEEYYSTDVDAHERYLPSSSVLFPSHQLQTPLIEIWMDCFQRKFSKIYPDYPFLKREHQVQITHDIDHPFLYRNKGLFLSVYGGFRDFFKKEQEAVKTRLKTLFFLQEDPYFNLHDLKELAQRNGFIPVFFIHTGPFAKNDRKYLYPSPRYKRVLKKLVKEVPLGLHPSYASDSNPTKICREKERLQRWTGRPITRSRQHYLRFSFPQTPQALLKVGIKDDFSLGYSDVSGFRAGTCHPFPFFDLEKNQETKLMLHPLVAMDVTFKRTLTVNEAKKKILFLNEQCRKAGGKFTVLFHNSSFVEQEGWKGWKKMYESLLNDLAKPYNLMDESN